MGLAQTLLTIAAIALLGTITLTLNTSYLSTNQTMVESEFTIEAVSIAESYLERAVGKSFDEKSIESSIKKPDEFSSIGKDGGENTLADFDDFDDFHGYKTKETTERAVYDVSISVTYVYEDQLDKSTSKKNWHKKITITVGNEYMKTAPVSLDYIYSYFGTNMENISGASGSSEEEEEEADD